jgi:hypothetical protein
MSRTECAVISAMALTFTAIVAAAQISGVTIDELRSDALLRWIVSFFPELFA